MVLVPYQESVSIFQGPDGEQRKKLFNRYNCLDYHLSASTPRPVLPDACKQLIFAMSSVIYDGGKRKFSFRCCLVLWGCSLLTGNFSAALSIFAEPKWDWKPLNWNDGVAFLRKCARPFKIRLHYKETYFTFDRVHSVFVTEMKGVLGEGFFFLRWCLNVAVCSVLQHVTVIPRALGGTWTGRWFVTLLEVSVNARRMWWVRGVTAVHQDRTDLDRRAAVVSTK